MTDTNSRELTLLDYGRVVCKNWLVILALLILGGIGAVIYSAVTPKMYEAKATILPPELTVFAGARSAAGGGLLSSLGLAENSATNIVLGMLKSETMADALIEKFDLKKRYDVSTRSKALKQLSKATRFSVSKENVLTVYVEDRDPAMAAAMANFYLEHLETLNAQKQITASKPMVHVLDTAQPPEQPSRPNLLLNLGAALGAAFIVGVLVALLREMATDKK
jgi:tyrosine-protein kinase Etk/Wzc